MRIAMGLSLLASMAFADEAQVQSGQKLYAKNCAGCHGDAGEGSKKAPPVVGKAALPLDPPAGAKVRKTQFHTAKDVAEFVVKNMPAKKPGSLKADEYWAILAFDLKANGVDFKDKLDADSAAKIVLHP
jgi:polar amino acid transport system substrate-binding protein